MSDEDTRNRVSMLYQILELLVQYEEGFIERNGKKGYQQKIDNVLDELNHWRPYLKKMNNDKEK